MEEPTNSTRLREQINKEWLYWQLIILYHKLAEVEEKETEWRVTLGYQHFSQEEINLLFLYDQGNLKIGDFHAREMAHAKLQIQHLEKEDQKGIWLKKELQMWEERVNNEFETAEITIRRQAREHHIPEEDIFNTVMFKKKHLLHHILALFQQERIKLDIQEYFRNSPFLSNNNLEYFFVKREMLRYYNDYLKFKEKIFFYELLLQTGIMLRKNDREHIVGRYADLSMYEHRKNWCKEHYYYSPYYELHDHTSPITSHIKVYQDTFFKRNHIDDVEPENADESLAERRQRFKLIEKEKRSLRTSRQLNTNKKKKDELKKYEDQHDPIGFAQLGRELTALLIVEPDDLNENMCSIKFNYEYFLETKKHENEDKQDIIYKIKLDAIKHAEKLSQNYIDNLIAVNRKVDSISNKNLSIDINQNQFLIDLLTSTRSALNTVESPLKTIPAKSLMLKNISVKKVENKKLDFLKRHKGKIIFGGICLIALIILLSILSSGVIPAIAAGMVVLHALALVGLKGAITGSEIALFFGSTALAIICASAVVATITPGGCCQQKKLSKRKFELKKLRDSQEFDSTTPLLLKEFGGPSIAENEPNDPRVENKVIKNQDVTIYSTAAPAFSSPILQPENLNIQPKI